MKINEAINHLKEVLADENKDWSCEECKNEYIQLLEWLEELNRLRHDVQKWIDFCTQLLNENIELKKLQKLSSLHITQKVSEEFIKKLENELKQTEDIYLLQDSICEEEIKNDEH